MTRYKITFEYIVNDLDSDGKWYKDCLDNDGEGFTYDQASDEAFRLRSMSFPNQNRNIKIVEM